MGAERRWSIVVLSALAVVFGSLTIAILRYKHLTIDEFQYAHSAWLVAQGQIPYRDFFNDRFPLLYQSLGIISCLRVAKPEEIIFLRWLLLPVLALTIVLAALVNRRRGVVTALLGVVLLLGTWTFTTRAIEIRPDLLAFTLFLGALVVLSEDSISDNVAAFVAGVLVAASVWASLKVAVYGCIFAVVLALPRRRRVLRNDLFFIAGFAAIAALVAAYLWMSNSLPDWFTWAVKWAYVHEAHYPNVPLLRSSAPFLRDYWWLIVLGAIGWVRSLREDRREILLLLALPSTLLSFIVQRAPFEYSLIPFIGILAVFASRGLVLLFDVLPKWRPVLILACACVAAFATFRSWHSIEPRVDAQLSALRQLAVVTNPTDAVYDNTGGYFARPHAWYFFYTDEVLRRRLFATMNADVQEALRRSQAPAVLMDLRFRGLPTELQRFIGEHYQPYADNIRLWGMRFETAPTIDRQFWAIQRGSYFVHPAEVLQSGVLTIDGMRISSQIFRLSAGEHRVTYAGAPSALSILWLPRDGKPYAPDFSGRFPISFATP